MPGLYKEIHTPKRYRRMPDYKYSFGEPSYQEIRFIDEGGKTKGLLRIKPSGVLWKPTNAQKFYAMPLDKFEAWITDPNTSAKRTAN